MGFRGNELHFHGALRLLVGSWQQDSPPASDETLPEIAPGAFAAWAHSESRREVFRIKTGDACLMRDGRLGRVVEMLDDDVLVLACQAV